MDTFLLAHWGLLHEIGIPIHLCLFSQELVAPGRTKTCPTANAQLFVKNKMMFWLLFQEYAASARLTPEVRDPCDNATIKYINNSFRTASIDSQERVSNVLLQGIYKWSRCMACCSCHIIAPIARLINYNNSFCCLRWRCLLRCIMVLVQLQIAEASSIT